MMETIGAFWVITLAIMVAITYAGLFGYLILSIFKWPTVYMRDKFFSYWLWPAGITVVMSIISLMFGFVTYGGA